MIWSTKIRTLEIENRGKAVATEIKKQYGEDVVILIPPDVYAVTHTFKRGFNSILPNKL